MTAVVHLFSFAEYRQTPVECNGHLVPVDLRLPIVDRALPRLRESEVPWPEIVVGIVALLAQHPDWPDREAYARLALAYDPEIVAGLIVDASHAVSRQDWRGARPYLRAALALAPDSPEALYLLGATCYQRACQTTVADGDPLLRTTLLHEADRALTHHAELSTADGLGRFVHGLVLVELGRTDAAVQELQAALALGLTDDAIARAEALIARSGTPDGPAREGGVSPH